MLSRFTNLNYRIHLVISFVIRLVLIAYGVCHDKFADVPYTDIDYKVFTDAARYVFDSKSPYERHTYRYSPLIAILMIPNIQVHHTFGKVLFSIVDILVGLLTRILVKSCIEQYEKSTKGSGKQNSIDNNHKKKRFTMKSNAESWADISMLVWLYNPMTLAISTRGNSDSIACLLVLLTLYFLEHKKSYFKAGLVHGLCIHFRLYPVIYSLAYFMHLSKFAQYAPSYESEQREFKNKNNSVLREKRETIFKLDYFQYFVPNLSQILLVCGTGCSLASLTAIFYHLYGYEFLFETYIYHSVRSDPKHNFSLYFYLQYLSAWVKNIGLWQKVLTVLPQLILLIVFSFKYGLYRISLNFAVLVLTIVMVIYNGVLTSQYFVWIAGILPLCLWQINISKKAAVLLISLWFLAQGAWLLPAYLLEFKGKNTFIFIWLQGVAFFCVNSAILGRLIMYFMPYRVKNSLKAVQD